MLHKCLMNFIKVYLKLPLLPKTKISYNYRYNDKKKDLPKL